jgi:hypothetical protein
MHYKFVESINPITNPQDIRMPAGLFAGILVKWYGTAETAVTVAQTDFGTILVRHRGRNIVNARARDIYIWDELAGGYSRWVSAEAAAFELAIFIPFRYGEMPGGNDDNLLNCGPDELFISIPGLDTAKFATCTCDVGVVDAAGVSRYIVQISTQTIGTMSLNQPVRLQIPNLQDVVVDSEDITTDPTTVFLTRNGKVMFEGPWVDLEALSDMVWEREAAGIDGLMVRMGRDDFPSFVGGRYDLRLIGGVGDVHVLECGALPVSSEEYQAVKAVQETALAEQYASSPEPPAADVAPATPEDAVAAGGAVQVNQTTLTVTPAPNANQAPRLSTVGVYPNKLQAPSKFVGSRRIGL